MSIPHVTLAIGVPIGRRGAFINAMALNGESLLKRAFKRRRVLN